MCVGTQAHGRGMGFSPDTTSHTHPQRAGEKERKEERGLLQFGCVYCWQAEPSKEFSAGMRMSLFLIKGLEYMLPVVTEWRDQLHASCFLSIMCLCKDTIPPQTASVFNHATKISTALK